MEQRERPYWPDYATYRSDRSLVRVAIEGQALRLLWDDGRESRHHSFWLRENSPEPATLHPQSREMRIDPSLLPAALHPGAARIDGEGYLSVVWSHGGHKSRFDPAWLYAHAWFEEDGKAEAPSLWDASVLREPPSFDGPAVLSDESLFLDWLIALRSKGIARLRNLPSADSTLEDLVTRIGPVRESNFGRRYRLRIKADPDSNAFTSGALLPHIDMPTRECPHGLQFFFCHHNTAEGGEGSFVDGFRIAEDIRRDDPELFRILSQVNWTWNNRARDTDYRAEAPIFGLHPDGRMKEVRFTPWLRAPLQAPVAVQEKAYQAVHRLIRMTRDPQYQLLVTYRDGDLVAFDNRRLLHGRTAYEAKGGVRDIEGIYADRDDLESRIRVLQRG